MTKLDPIQEQVITALRRIIRAIDLHSRQLIQRHGFTGPQLIVLSKLMSQSEVSIGELAESISLSHPTVTGILARLEKRGMIQRVRGQRDKRQFLVTLTELGKETLKDAPPLMQERFIRDFGNLEGWEQSQILSSLLRLVGMMEARDLDASPLLMTGPVISTAREMRVYYDDARGEPPTPRKRGRPRRIPTVE